MYLKVLIFKLQELQILQQQMPKDIFLLQLIIIVIVQQKFNNIYLDNKRKQF